MRKFNLKIEQESYPESPRAWDNLTTMICFHKRYNLGDEHNYTHDNFNSWEELKERLEEDYNIIIIKPLYIYMTIQGLLFQQVHLNVIGIVGKLGGYS